MPTRHAQTTIPLLIVAMVAVTTAVSMSHGEDIHPAYILIAGGAAAAGWLVAAVRLRLNEIGTAAGSLAIFAALAAAYGAFVAAGAGMLAAALLAHFALLPKKSPRP